MTATQVDEPELYRRTAGAGPDIVFCHGFAGSGRNWGAQVRALSLSHRCSVYDARGHARSSAKLEPQAFSFEHLVADVGRVLDAIGKEHATAAPRATLVGLSLGAATALEFALTEPARVRGLVLASPPPTDDERRRWALDFADALETEGAERAGERFVWGERSRFDVQGAASVRRGFLEHDPSALAQVLRQSLARLPDLAEQGRRLDRLDLPVLIVAGEIDAPSMAAAHDLAAVVRRSELVAIAGAGHVVNLAAPADFLAATRRLLAKTNERGKG